MAVQLIIDGAHMTDVLSQIHALAGATGGPKETVVYEKIQAPVETTAEAVAEPAHTVETPVENKPARLSAKAQDVAVAAMLEAGAKNDLFDKLTKGRQKAVEEGLAAPVAEKEEDVNLDSMFDDDAAEEPVEEITADTIRTMMGALGKDADGNPIQDNLLKIRDILTTYVPKGEDIKVGKIPQDKFADVYGELVAMAA